jgi:mannan endo-1,4-beta-mannosidase
MKYSIGAVLTFASLAFSTPVPDENASLVKRATNAFAVGTKINIEGDTTYFAGTNSYWISYLNNAADVDQTMKNIQASGLKVLRVWGRAINLWLYDFY